jgi:hypothetical protein
VLGVAPEWLLTGRAASGDSEAPALALDVYARDLHEETLLEHFRAMPAHARALLLQIAHQFDVSKSQSKRKRR